jgi:hypothetical protein
MISLELGFVKVLLDQVQLIVDDLGDPFAI